MTLPQAIDLYLHRHHIQAESHDHQPTWTARELAAVEAVPETQVAKTIFFLADEQMVMGVVPANRHLNLHLAKRATGASSVRLASEEEIRRHIGSLELGSVPPFGSLVGMPVILDSFFRGATVLVVPGGTHTQSIRLRMKDLQREEGPQMLPLSRRPIHYRQQSTEPYQDFF